MFSEQEQIPHPPTPLTSGSRERFKSERAPYSSEPIISISAKYPLSTSQIAPQQQSRRIPRTHGPLQRQQRQRRYLPLPPPPHVLRPLFRVLSQLTAARLAMIRIRERLRLIFSSSARRHLIRMQESFHGLICPWRQPRAALK